MTTSLRLHSTYNLVAERATSFPGLPSTVRCLTTRSQGLVTSAFSAVPCGTPGLFPRRLHAAATSAILEARSEQHPRNAPVYHGVSLREHWSPQHWCAIERALCPALLLVDVRRDD